MSDERKDAVLHSVLNGYGDYAKFNFYTNFLMREDKEDFELTSNILMNKIYSGLPVEALHEVHVNHFAAGTHEEVESFLSGSKRNGTPHNRELYISELIDFVFKDDKSSIEGLPVDWIEKLALGALKKSKD